MTAERTVLAAPGASSRLRSLDGLRGAAALIVVFHHSLLVVPAFAAQYYHHNAIDNADMFTWLMAYTPLHLLWQGQAAVYVFFVLSGIVLTLPVLNSRHFSWRAYYPQRLLRLYLPVWGALAFGLLTILAVPRVGGGMSAWVHARSHELSPHRLLLDTTLVSDAGKVVSPLWSLQWEVLFSLLLPLFVWLAVKFRSILVIKAILLLGLVFVAASIHTDKWLFYLSMFLVGSLFATELERIRLLGSRLDKAARPRLAWWIVFGCGLVMINSTWFLKIAKPEPWLIHGADALALLGGVLVIFVATCWGSARRFLESKPLQWLGLMSFSLYLVHEPIVIAMAYLFGPSLVWVAIPVGIVAALAFTWVFHKVVEHPSHRLAQAVKRRLSPQRHPGQPAAEREPELVAKALP